MARGKRGRPVHGWLIVDKPAGVTSAAVVALAKRALGAAKVGHAGTLDPAATGLLALAFGEATKTVPYVTDARKAYRFSVRWGTATATDDAEGGGDRDVGGAARPCGDRGRASGIPWGDHASPAPGIGREGRGRACLRPRTGRRDPRPRGAAADGRQARTGRRPGRGHGGLRDDLREGRVRAQHRPGPRRATRLPRPRDGPASPLVRPVRPRRCGRVGGARGRGRDLRARRPAPSGARRPRRPDGDRLPGARRGSPSQRQRHAAAGPLGVAEGEIVWASRLGTPLAVGAWRGGALHPSRVFVLG